MIKLAIELLKTLAVAVMFVTLFAGFIFLALIIGG
jgi:hypothetical protein